MSNSKSEKDATIAIHGGIGTQLQGAPVSPAPVLASSFLTHPDSVGFSANDLKEDAPHFYSRWSNPTLQILEERLAELEGGEAAVSFASGMAAVTALFFDKLKAGHHLVLSNVLYAGVAELAHDTLPSYGIEVTAVDTSDPQNVANAIRPNTRLVHIETPANPILLLSDIEAISAITRAAGVELSVDSTIATPIGLKPLKQGADYVVHSLTKYIGGHGDALGGAVIGSSEALGSLRRNKLIHFGGALAPFSAWLILRGLETLKPRMALHEENARKVEAFLAQHSAVRSVLWPGSERHPQHELAKRQLSNYSSLLSFSVKKDSLATARQFAERLKVFSYAVSLGKTKSLLFYIPTDDILHSSFKLEGEAAALYREWAGEGVFRVSVGLEDADDLIADLQRALA